MKSTRLHISQTLFMPSLLKNLRREGIQIDRFLKSSKLNHFDLTKHENYVPNILLYDFMNKVQRSQGLYSIVNQFYEDFRLKSGGGFGINFFKQPNLLQSLQGVVNMPYILRSNQNLNLEINGNKAAFGFDFTDKPSKEREVLEDIGWAQTFDAFKSAGGNDWHPLAIFTTYSSFKRIEHIVPKGDYPIYFNKKSSKIVFPTSMLFNKLICPELSIQTELSHPDTYTNQVSQLLKSTASGVALGLNDLSNYTNLPVRTIKRKLFEEGTNYSQIASNVFLEKATTLLTKTNLSIREISESLGYQNISNFTRAFKNKIQLSPEAFRDQL